MNEEILSIIEKNLPAQIGKKLQERLALVETLESAHERDLDKISEYAKKESEWLDANAWQNRLDDLKIELDKREQEIRKRELEADKKEAESKAKNAEEKVQMMKDLLGQVFKSPVYRREGYRDGESFHETINPQSDY